MTEAPIVPPLQLSIVATMFHSAPYVEEFCRRASAAAQAFAGSYEIILVNDGSPDRSLELAIGLCRSDAHIRVIDLSRNFGHHKAMMTGLAHAAGELVFLIDSDLEEDPGWLRLFHETLERERADVAYGVQRQRKGLMISRFAGAVYYSTVHAMLDPPMPRNVMTVRLMTARYVSQLVRHRDRAVCIAALWVITGFKQVAVAVDKKTRRTSSYGFPARVAAMVDAVTSFSSRPLVFIFYLGCAIMLSAALAAALLVWRVLFHSVAVAGYPSLIISVWFLGGVTTFCLGVIGIYLSKIFMETKERPYAIVRAYYPESAGLADRVHD